MQNPHRAEESFPIQWYQRKETPTLTPLHVAAVHPRVTAVPHAAHAHDVAITNWSFGGWQRQRLGWEIGTARWTHCPEYQLKAHGKAKENNGCVYTVVKSDLGRSHKHDAFLAFNTQFSLFVCPYSHAMQNTIFSSELSGLTFVCLLFVFGFLWHTIISYSGSHFQKFSASRNVGL